LPAFDRLRYTANAHVPTTHRENQPMRRVIVQYKVKADQAGENQRLI
jgi:hypothetical protein